ncbi:hypothetical protein PG993_011799 [Apiospora rasikravindrae]|uniref:Uncharacterized protein n=1 Tax=Apiospora rasikravindrae TaxID=990691 RepID=A0ABR1S0R5_9PEZI
MSQQADPDNSQAPTEDDPAGGANLASRANGASGGPSDRSRRTFIYIVRAGITAAFLGSIWGPSATAYRKAWRRSILGNIPVMLWEVTDRVLHRFLWILDLGRD